MKAPLISEKPGCNDFKYKQIDRSINGIPETVDIEKREMIQTLLDLQERFTSIVILRPNADLYLTHPLKNQLKATKYNFADRPYLKEVNRTRKPVISDSFIGASNIPLVVIVVPVINKKGTITAYIGGAFYLINLSRLVNNERISDFDAGFIVDKKGHLVAHTNTNLVQEEFRKRYVDHVLVSKFLDKSRARNSKIVVEDTIDPINGK